MNKLQLFVNKKNKFSKLKLHLETITAQQLTLGEDRG